ncbi:MAG TPA: hypothetical protein VGG12_05510, partial [Methylovirgula sp.]
MLAAIKKHWGSLLLAFGINGPSLWAGLKWLWDWASRFDLVVSHADDISKVGGVIAYVTNPPPWTIFPTVAIGILIVLWDVRHP